MAVVYVYFRLTCLAGREFILTLKEDGVDFGKILIFLKLQRT